MSVCVSVSVYVCVSEWRKWNSVQQESAVCWMGCIHGRKAAGRRELMARLS